MEATLKSFIYHKNGWSSTSGKVNPNIRNEKMGRLLLDGIIFATDSFAILQMKKKQYCKTYGISKEAASRRFKLTY